MNAQRLVVSIVLALGIALAAPPAIGQEPRFDLGLRLDVVAADGVPANDIPAVGLFGHRRLSERWWIGLAVDHSPKFDVERPYEFLGLVGDPAAGEIDADATSTRLTGWIERVYARPGRRLEWFWSAGGGVALIDVDAVAGPLDGGGSYDIAQEVKTELLASVGAGLRLGFARRWAFEAALRADRHFTDWTVADRVSGRAASLTDYTVQGIDLGMAYRF